MLVHIDVRLVPDGLRPASGNQDPRFCEFGERGVNGARELGDDGRGLGMHLVGGKVFSGFVGERAKDRSPLRSYTHAASPSSLPESFSGAIAHV